MSHVLLFCTFGIAFAVGALGQSEPRKLDGLNFSPFLAGQSPSLTPQVAASQIEARLEVVSARTKWIRSFGSTGGLEQIPPIAQGLGLKVAASAWIGDNLTQNDLEIASLIANVNSGHVDIAIVGSEALLREDVSEAQLLAYMSQVRQAISPVIPVTTADTYGVLLAHPNVIAASDVVLVNFYPYWEWESINTAICSLEGAYQRLETAAGGKPVIISETGWPSGGNALGAAVPSPTNAARYFLEFVTWAEGRGIPYFYFSAFDEAWKVAFEGPQGAHWGAWDELGILKPEMEPVFKGQTSEVACEGVPGGPGEPAIDLVFVPPYGSADNPTDGQIRLQGEVRHVNTSTHGVAVYIKVGSGWWVKPFAADRVTVIQPDGSWSTRIATGGSDPLATDIAAFLIPLSYIPPLVLGQSLLPGDLYANALAHVEAHRTPGSISGAIRNTLQHPLAGVVISAGALGTAKTAPDGSYSFSNLAGAVEVTLAPSYPGFVFTPPAATLSVSNANQRVNFTGISSVDLAMTSALSNNQTVPGSVIAATFVASNAGLFLASGVQVVIELPGSVSVVPPLASSKGNCVTNLGHILCQVGELQPTTSATVTVGLSAASVGSFQVVATVSGADPDSNLDNNSFSQTLDVAIAKAHLGVFIDGLWFIDRNGDGLFNPLTEIQGWGSPGDIPVSADWSGDGFEDVAVFSGGLWFIDRNGDGQFDPSSELVGWGMAGWIPMPGDWNGDGVADLGVVDPATMTWFRDLNGDGVFDPATEMLGWGSPGDIPVVGDWNGDGIDDVAAFSNGAWFIDLNGDGAFDPSTEIVGWGVPGSLPVVGDWNGDGRTKLGIVTSDSVWFRDVNGDRQFDPATEMLGWGSAGDKPVARDWSGDGRTNVGVFSGGTWFLDFNGDEEFDPATEIRGWGVAGWTPTPGVWR